MTDCKVLSWQVSPCPEVEKGKGLFTTRKVPFGELILSETHLVKVTVPHSPKTLAKFLSQIRSGVKQLDEDDQELFFSLHNARRKLCTKNRDDLMMMSIFQCNSVMLREYDKFRGKEIGSGVFPTISRINHSCRPNCVLSYNISSGECELRPSRDLEKEEEITISYVDPLNSSADRQKLLQAKYNFTCQCKVCSLESQELAANDKLRREILGLTNNMEDIYVSNPRKAFKFGKMKLERMEMLRQEMIELLPQTYLDCYELCLALEEKEIAEIFAVKGKQIAQSTRGNNSLWFKLNCLEEADTEK